MLCKPLLLLHDWWLLLVEHLWLRLERLMLLLECLRLQLLERLLLLLLKRLWLQQERLLRLLECLRLQLLERLWLGVDRDSSILSLEFLLVPIDGLAELLI